MKLYVQIITALLIISAFISCEKQNDGLSDLNSKETIGLFTVENQQTADVVLTDDGYLSFKNQEVYFKINDMVDKMTDDEFEAWEQKLGFESALSYINKVHDQIENIKTYEEFNELKQHYSLKLVFEDDGSVRLPFYATAWERVLNIDGVMKIGNTLYKSTKDREYIVSYGTYDDLKDLAALEANTEKCRVFYPQREINNNMMKSIEWGIIDDGDIKTGNKRGDSWLEYDLQMFSYNYTGCGATTTLNTEAGFDFKLKLQQNRKGLFGWYHNETVYEFRNMYSHIEYDEPERWVNVYYNGVLTVEKWGGDHVNINEYPADITSYETRNGVTLNIHRFYFCEECSWTHVEPEIYDFDCTFWSRGIGYNLRHIMHYSNQ